MIASFFVIFVAFAICQAVLTVKFADVLSPSDRADGVVAGPARAMASATLA